MSVSGAGILCRPTEAYHEACWYWGGLAEWGSGDAPVVEAGEDPVHIEE
ncbi:hypothetical protein ACFL59_15580 [Planctomycetota bacterium]